MSEVFAGEPPAFDLDEAFFALEQLDDQGRLALTLVCALLDEVHQGALRRAARAEWALGRLSGWACEAGLTVDPSEVLAEWDDRSEPALAPLTHRYHVQLSERVAEVKALRDQLDELMGEREQLSMRAEQAQRALLHLHPKDRKS
jgi:hypothetical protein